MVTLISLLHPFLSLNHLNCLFNSCSFSASLSRKSMKCCVLLKNLWETQNFCPKFHGQVKNKSLFPAYACRFGLRKTPRHPEEGPMMGDARHNIMTSRRAATRGPLMPNSTSQTALSSQIKLKLKNKAKQREL